MEYIFLESTVLQTLIDKPITTDYILTNYREIIPDHQTLDKLKDEFINLYQGNTTQILETKIEPLLSILHKYGIKTYYNIFLEYTIWQILQLKYKPENLCSDIISDIISYNQDFTSILKFLIKQEKIQLKPEDFLFSVQLLNANQDNIDTNYIDKNYINYMSIWIPIKYNLFEVVQYLIEHFKSHILINDICVLCAYYGRFEILKWAHQYCDKTDVYVCINAASEGYFDILKWAHENGHPWNSDVCNVAIEKGHLEILKWARANGCPWNIGEYTFKVRLLPEILKWIESQE